MSPESMRVAEQKPTEEALRIAVKIVESIQKTFRDLGFTKPEKPETVARLTAAYAELIDRETNLTQLRATCARLREDQQRLDWLEEHAVGWADHGDSGNYAMYSVEIDFFKEESLRAAIDAARSATSTKPLPPTTGKGENT